MNTTKFPTRLRVRVLISTTVTMMILVLGSCHRDSLPREASSALRVTKVAAVNLHASASDEKDQSVVQACRGWSLTAAQVERFFSLSKEYKQDPYSLFYQVPCSISGELTIDGKTWEFVINGGATAIWNRKGVTRHWGCGAAKCEPLVLMPTDFMNSEP
jgi:hypothetical protein